MDEKCLSVSARAWKGNARELTHVKPRLCNTRALLSRARYVRLGWDLARLSDSQGLVEKTAEEWLAFLIKAIQEQEEG
jgi:hypothetical protein